LSGQNNALVKQVEELAFAHKFMEDFKKKVSYLELEINNVSSVSKSTTKYNDPQGKDEYEDVADMNRAQLILIIVELSKDILLGLCSIRVWAAFSCLLVFGIGALGNCYGYCEVVLFSFICEFFRV